MIQTDVTAEDADQVMEKLDRNKDGSISFIEFKRAAGILWDDPTSQQVVVTIHPSGPHNEEGGSETGKGRVEGERKRKG